MKKISQINRKIYTLFLKTARRITNNCSLRDIVIGISVTGISLLIANFTFAGSKKSIIEIYEENIPEKIFYLDNSMIENFNNMMVDLKKLSRRYGFFTVREFAPNSPQYKIFVVYFQNREAFSLSIEPSQHDEHYIYMYRLGRLDADGNYIKSDIDGIVFKSNEFSKLKDVIVKFLFGRVPIDITTLGTR